MNDRRGVVTAFVKQTDVKQGRVVVEYRSIDDKLESTWAPIASPMSGKGRGALFMPEPGDEALVAFQDGKFDSPYVVGFLWNGQQTTPEDDPENRVIVTPGGHQLRFEDREPAKKIVIKSTQHTVTLDDTPGTPNISINAGPAGVVSIKLNTTPPSITISTGTGTVSMGVTDVTVTSAGNITLNAAGVVTLNCPVLAVNSGFATFSGAVQCSTLLTNAVVSPLYTPGIGNVI
jgi:uncharacterized protein involved in type VI secretion and phage assembly